jgi:hypothetical protein
MAVAERLHRDRPTLFNRVVRIPIAAKTAGGEHAHERLCGVVAALHR